MKVSVAFEIAEVAVAQYDEYVQYCMKTEWNWDELDRLARIANDAERQLKALNGCTCTPRTDMCPACLSDNVARYGDSIPFGGE